MMIAAKIDHPFVAFTKTVRASDGLWRVCAEIGVMCFIF
jgi:hypothetical protein